MPADHPVTRARGAAGLAVFGLAICCGVPVLLSIAAGVTIAGLGLGSWVLILAGVVIAASAVWWRRRRVHCVPPVDQHKSET